MSHTEPTSDPFKLSTNSLAFVKLCWPDMVLYDKQQEILLSVRNHLETFVHAANQTGKTRIAAITAIWFFFSRTPARVLITSSNEDQLRRVLWGEIWHLIETSAMPLPFVIQDLLITKRTAPGSAERHAQDFIKGCVPRNVESFQGHHLPNDKPRVLAIFDEASAVPDELYEAASSCAHRQLVIGNPLSNSGFFYRRCKSGDMDDPAGELRLARKVIHIDGRDSPNVRAGFLWKEKGKVGKPPVIMSGPLRWEEFVRRLEDWDEMQCTIRLRGKFYEGERQQLIPAAWLDAAMDVDRWAEIRSQDRQAQAMGIDVASGGRDKTCWTIIDYLGIIKQIVADVSNSMDIVRRTTELVEEYGLLEGAVAVDAGGGGNQIADRLFELGVSVKLVYFGGSAGDKKSYVNRRAEMYGILKEQLDPQHEQGSFALPPDAYRLRQELAVLPRGEDSEGRLMLPPKNTPSNRSQDATTIRKLLGRSPDRADSLVLAVWALMDPTGRPIYYDRDLIICPDPLDENDLDDDYSCSSGHAPPRVRRLHGHGKKKPGF